MIEQSGAGPTIKTPSRTEPKNNIAPLKPSHPNTSPKEKLPAPLASLVDSITNPNQQGAERAELYDPELIKLEADSLVQAHEILGYSMKSEVHRVIETKLKPVQDADVEGLDALIDHLTFSRQCLAYLKEQQHKLDFPFSKAAASYLECLQNWAYGAELDKFATRLNDQLQFKPESALTDLDIAFWLQNENVGCMTGILKDADGSHVMAHFEEYSGVDRNRIIHLQVGSLNFVGFGYPELLPFTGFGVRFENNSPTAPMIMTVDSKFTKNKGEPGALVNMAAWAVNFGELVDPAFASMSLSTIVSGFGPYVDGYSIQRLSANQDEALVPEAVTIALDKVVRHDVSSKIDVKTAYIQGNTLAESIAPEVEEPDKNWPKYAKRVERWQRFVQKIKPQSLTNLTAVLSRFMAFRIGGDFANANPDVWASLTVKVNPDNFELQIFPGWLRKDELQKPPHWSLNLTLDSDGLWQIAPTSTLS